MQYSTKDSNNSRASDEMLVSKVDVESIDKVIKEKVEPIKPEVAPDLIFKIDGDFVKARMNKDNFWNLAFLVGTSLTVLIAEILAGLIPKGGWLLLTAAIILTPYFLAKINKVEVIEDEIRTSSGRIIPEKLPQSSGALLLLTFIAIFFWVVGSMAFSFNSLSFSNINFSLWNMILWLPTIMYFILKNYPINMFFHKATWGKLSPVFDTSYDHHSSSVFPSTSYYNTESIVTSPRYSYLSCNIYHRK